MGYLYAFKTHITTNDMVICKIGCCEGTHIVQCLQRLNAHRQAHLNLFGSSLNIPTVNPSARLAVDGGAEVGITTHLIYKQDTIGVNNLETIREVAYHGRADVLPGGDDESFGYDDLIFILESQGTSNVELRQFETVLRMLVGGHMIDVNTTLLPVLRTRMPHLSESALNTRMNTLTCSELVAADVDHVTDLRELWTTGVLSDASTCINLLLDANQLQLLLPGVVGDDMYRSRFVYFHNQARVEIDFAHRSTRRNRAAIGV